MTEEEKRRDETLTHQPGVAEVQQRASERLVREPPAGSRARRLLRAAHRVGALVELEMDLCTHLPQSSSRLLLLRRAIRCRIRAFGGCSSDLCALWPSVCRALGLGDGLHVRVRTTRQQSECALKSLERCSVSVQRDVGHQ